MIKCIGNDSFKIILSKSEEENGVSEYTIVDEFESSSLNFIGFKEINDLIDLLNAVKSNKMK